MSNKKDFKKRTGAIALASGRVVLPSIVAVLIMSGVLLTGSAFAQPVTPFKATSLVKPGDEVRYGSYLVRKIGDGIYQLNDPGDKETKGGGWGVDMYLVCGTKRP